MQQFIEATIKSILNQNYSNKEIIVIDGGSKDGTLEILKKYSNDLTCILSESDNGQYYAIEKGFKLATGDILCWLNADDIYFPWALETVGKIFANNLDVKWLCGIPAFMNEDGTLRKIYNSISAKQKNAIINGWYRKEAYGYLQQESMFWRKELYYLAGGLNMNYSLAADFDLWCKFAFYTDLWTVDLPLAAFRLRQNSRSKVDAKRYNQEVNSICKHKKKIPIIFRLLGQTQLMNKLLRVFTWKKTKIIHQPFLFNISILEERYRSCSSLTLSQLLLEIVK